MTILESAIRFIVNQSIPIYIICVIGGIYNLIRLGQASSSGRRATFGYEKELVQNLRTSSIFYLVLFLITAISVYGINIRLVPQLDPVVFAPPTPTVDLFRLTSPTPITTSTPIPGTPRPRVTPNLAPTATLAGDVAGQVAPDPDADPSVEGEAQATLPAAVALPEGGGCTPGVNLTFPTQDSAVFGTIEFVGSATADQFAAYQLELRGDGTLNEWVDVLGGRTFQPIENDALGVVNLSPLENGEYDLRLTVFNLEGSPVTRCSIRVQVNNE